LKRLTRLLVVPPWYSFAEATTNLTGEEVFAKLSPQSD
jgi:hypothetical protein